VKHDIPAPLRGNVAHAETTTPAVNGHSDLRDRARKHGAATLPTPGSVAIRRTALPNPNRNRKVPHVKLRRGGGAAVSDSRSASGRSMDDLAVSCAEIPARHHPCKLGATLHSDKTRTDPSCSTRGIRRSRPAEHSDSSGRLQPSTAANRGSRDRVCVAPRRDRG